ncbi:MAG: nitroreductase family protein, partial [Dehalococcoidia bacterium]
YKSTPVSKDDLNTVLESARWAPSWANTQCRRFVVVEDRETRVKLSETLPETNSARVGMVEAPVVIVACAVLGKSGYKRGEVMSDKGDWFMFDTAIAMQNLVLAAHAIGLGTVYIGLFDAKKAAGVLELPDGVVVVAMTPLGYPEAEGKITSRLEPAEMFFYEKYGKPGA